MATEGDVQNAIVVLIARLLYPAGILQPSAVGSPVKVYPGWPNSRALDADMVAGIVNVTVFQQPGAARNLTTSLSGWVVKGLPAQTTLVWTLADNTATLSGTIAIPQNLAITVNGNADYEYAVQATDTLVGIVAAMAALIPGATAAGPLLTVPATANLAARVGVSQTMIKEVRRQSLPFIVTIWAPTPALREAVTAVIDGQLSYMARIDLDAVSGRVRWMNSRTIDTTEGANLYERHITYDVNYPTTIEMVAPQAIVVRTVALANTLPLPPVTPTPLPSIYDPISLTIIESHP